MTWRADGQSVTPTNTTTLHCELHGTLRSIPYNKYVLMLFCHINEQLTYKVYNNTNCFYERASHF